MKIWLILLIAFSQRVADSESLHLRWGPSPTTGVIGYKVFMKPGDGSYPEFYSIGITNTNEFRTVDLPSGSYKFRVCAYDKNGTESEPCEEIELVIPVRPPVFLQIVTNENSTVIWPKAMWANTPPTKGEIIYRGTNYWGTNRTNRKPARTFVPPIPPIK